MGKRVYEVALEGGTARESAQLRETPAGLECRVYRALPGGEGWAWELEAGPEGEVRRLEWRREGAASAAARWRWEADSWVGRLESAGRSSEAVWPMAAGLQPVFPAVVSDLLLLRRLALRPGSQRRLETLPVSAGALEGEPSHVLADRLDGRSYRLTDDSGGTATLVVDEAGWPLERVGGQAYRFVGEEGA